MFNVKAETVDPLNRGVRVVLTDHVELAKACLKPQINTQPQYTYVFVAVACHFVLWLRIGVVITHQGLSRHKINQNSTKAQCPDWQIHILVLDSRNLCCVGAQLTSGGGGGGGGGINLLNEPSTIIGEEMKSNSTVMSTTQNGSATTQPIEKFDQAK